MQWSEVVANPTLQNLPFKIELNDWGQVVMSPATRVHVIFQKRIQVLLDTLYTGGEAFTECPVQTRKGVRVPDVAWVTEAQTEIETSDVFTRAPEICVEVISPSNKPEEIEEKILLYFAAGALEVWTCDLKGRMQFFDPLGKLKTSKLVPEFPKLVKQSRV